MARTASSTKFYVDLRSSTEELLREGKVLEARKLLRVVKPKRIPREFGCEFANLLRRSGQVYKAAKVLWPYVRSDRPMKVKPVSQELSEFALCLITLGVPQEAIHILENLVQRPVEETTPYALLHLGFARMVEWNYLAAIPCFRRFLMMPGISDYERCVAKVNLAAAFVAIPDGANAEPLLRELAEVVEENQWKLLRQNVLELSAQLAVSQHDWDSADAFLDRIQAKDGPLITLADLFVHKWRALSALYRTNGAAMALESLASVRAAALNLKHWETVRDCDFHRARVERDAKLYQAVYFGTPFSSYRDRLRQCAAGWLELPQEYEWYTNGQMSERVFDLKSSREIGGDASMKPGQTLARAMQALTADFYRPVSICSLHALVFPKDHFNPHTSPIRIRQVVWRLREWCKKSDVPLEIVSNEDGLRLVAKGNYGFRLSLFEPGGQGSEKLGFQILLDQLRDKWREEKFSSSQAARSLKVSERHARDILRWGLNQTQLVRIGAGPKTLYRFIETRGLK